MAIRPQPTTWRCHHCGWSKTVHPRSDALMPGEHFHACPDCGRAPLERRAASAIEQAVNTLGGLFRSGPGRK